ncbi:MAG: tetratricopeptide repeat protein [Pseudomonadota bacterium]
MVTEDFGNLLISRLIAGSMLILLMGGCVTAPVEEVKPPPSFNSELLTGEILFGEVVRSSEAPAHDILGVDQAMLEFVGDIGERRLSVVRFNQLIDKLEDSGFFGNTYNASVTLTAADTFHKKIGNCISYTNLFVALARVAGLEVHFQIVPPVHPTWDAQDGMLIKNNHINLSIRGQRFDRNRGDGYTIDFNLVEPDPDAEVKRVSDEYAASLFYANLAISSLFANKPREGFAYLVRAIETEPGNPDLWINLAAIYNRFGQHRAAIESLQVAGQIDPRDRTVVSALERTYRILGDIETADRLAVKVRRHRQSNPYYFFALAQQARETGDLNGALVAIERAIKLKKQDPRFHHLQSVLHQAQGDAKLAQISLRRAKRQGWRG